MLKLRSTIRTLQKMPQQRGMIFSGSAQAFCLGMLRLQSWLLFCQLHR